MKKQNNQKQQSRSLRHWQAHLAALKKSGLSRAEYCRQHQLSYHALAYWYRKLAKPVVEETTLVPVTLSPSIRMNSVPSAPSPLKIILPNKIAVEVSDNFSPTTLTRLLTTLERR